MMLERILLTIACVQTLSSKKNKLNLDPFKGKGQTILNFLVTLQNGLKLSNFLLIEHAQKKLRTVPNNKEVFLCGL